MRKKIFILILIFVSVFSIIGIAYFYKLQEPALQGMYFVVNVENEEFVLYVTDEETIKLALENLNGLNSKFPNGELLQGDGGFNKPWSWHLKPESVRMVDFSIEVCSGLPSFVETDLDYWINDVKHFCPWSGKIVAASSEKPN